MSGERAGVAEVLLPTLITLVCVARLWRAGNWTVPLASGRLFSDCLPASFCLSMTPYLSFHLYPLSPLPVIVSLSAVLSSQRLLHLSARVIETCVPSLSAKRLADCLHFHAEGCDASVAALIVIDWDPSKPSPPLGSLDRLSSRSWSAMVLSVLCSWKWQHVLHASSTVAFVSTSHLFFYHFPLSISRTLTLALCSSLCLSMSFPASHSPSTPPHPQQSFP